MFNDRANTRRRTGRWLAGAASALVLVGLNAGVAGAVPDTGDDRAEFVPGNVSECPDGFVDVTASVNVSTGTGTNEQFLTISSVDAGVIVTRIYVKAGPDTNLYEPGERGLSADPPWTNLRAPTNPGGQQPDISHWFACGPTGNGTTTTTTTPGDTTTTTTEPGDTTTTTTEPGDTTTTTTTTQPGDTTTTTTQPGDTTTTTTQPGDTTTTTQPGDTTTTTQPGDSTTTQPGDTTTTQPGGVTTTQPGQPTTTTKLPTTGSNNVGAVLALALIALGAGGGAVVIARRNQFGS